MQLSMGVTALHALIEANSQAKALFERCPHAMLLSSMRCSTMELELQKMLCTIICIRQARKSHANEALQACINTLLKDRSTALEISSTASSKPMDTLSEAVDICNDITQAEISFVKVRLPKIQARIQSSISSDRFYRTMRHPFSLSFKARRQSPTELHRIRRALWRLRLYFEAYYEPYLPSKIGKEDCPAVKAQGKPTEALGIWGTHFAAKHDYILSQEVFFSHLTVWELEELECVSYHLSHQSSTLWRRPCPFCRQHLLPHDLIGHIREREQHVVSGTVLFRYGCNFQEACSWYRGDLECNYWGATTANSMAAWPGSLAKESSAGFTFLMDRHKEIDPHGDPLGVGWLMRGYLSEFLEWGYCIWDRETLEAWCLGDSEDGKVSAVLGWWTTDRWKRLRDDHHRHELSREAGRIPNSTHQRTHQQR